MNDPTELAIIKLLEIRSPWTGSPTGLLAELKAIGGPNAVQSSKGLANALTRLLPRFGQIGITVKRTKSGDRKIILTRTENNPSEPLEPYNPLEGVLLGGLPLIKCRDCKSWHCFADNQHKGIGYGRCMVTDGFTRWSESLHTCELFEEKKR
ncbi:MAG: hypothetical protein WCP01_03750 [Methylococcaceae bacterium]